MEVERKRFKFEILISRYFSNISKIILANLIFAIPSVIIFFVIYYINSIFFERPNYFIFLTSIIFLYPFFSGVIAIVRNIARGDDDFKVFDLYIKILKENFLQFLLHGVVLYIASVLSFLSISLYIRLLPVSGLFYVLLFVCLLIALFVFFASYYIGVMSVTFDISPINVYKNSFLMSFGELKNNFFATVWLLAFLIIFASITTIMAFSKSVVALIIVCAVFYIFIIPATTEYIIVFYIYDGMYSLIFNKADHQKKIEETISNGGKKIEKESTDFYDNFSDIDINSLKDTDDYIFHNGKMIKQSAILKQLKEKESGNNNDE